MLQTEYRNGYSKLLKQRPSSCLHNRKQYELKLWRTCQIFYFFFNFFREVYFEQGMECEDELPYLGLFDRLKNNTA